MSELKISQTQQKTQTTEQKPIKKQLNEKQIRVFEFESLPEKFQTPEMRAKIDTDGSGFIESENSKGEDETYGMSWLLSKFVDKSNVVQVKRTEDRFGIEFHGYNKDGKEIRKNRYIKDADLVIQHYIEAKNGKTIIKEYDTETRELKSLEIENGNKKYNCYYDNGIKRKSVKWGDAGFLGTHVSDSTFNAKGELEEVHHKEIMIACKSGGGFEPVSINHDTKFENNGKGKTKVYKAFSVGELSEVGEYQLVDTREKVAKGRTKVTDTKGHVTYYSHDGKKLKNSYIESEKQKAEEQKYKSTAKPWYERLANLFQ